MYTCVFAYVYICIRVYMYVYMYICIYVYMYICIYVYMYMYICICIYVYMCICIYVYMYICIYVYMYTCVYVYMYICIYVYMYVCIYVYMYICMYICIYVYMYICIYVYMYMYLCIYVFMYICIYVCMYICIYLLILKRRYKTCMYTKWKFPDKLELTSSRQPPLPSFFLEHPIARREPLAEILASTGEGGNYGELAAWQMVKWLGWNTELTGDDGILDWKISCQSAPRPSSRLSLTQTDSQEANLNRSNQFHQSLGAFIGGGYQAELTIS